ncbi:MAG: PAS domain S-box protein [bacterium]
MNNDVGKFTRDIQQSIFLSASIGLLIACLLVAAISIIPFQYQLKEQNKESLIFTAKIRSILVGEFLQKVFETSRQFTSRSNIRQILEQFNQGQITLSQYKSKTNLKLKDALDQSEFAVGVCRFDLNGNLVNEVGQIIPEHFRLRGMHSQKQTLLPGVWQLENKKYITVYAPILNRNDVLVGYDVVMFSATSLARMVSNYDDLGETGETILFHLDSNKQYAPVFDLRNEGISVDRQQLKQIIQVVEGMSDHLNEVVQPIHLGNDIVVANNIGGVDWKLIVRINDDELQRPVFKKMGGVILIIILIVPLSLAGLFVLLKPLTHRLKKQMFSLEKEVLARTKAEELYRRQSEQLNVTLRSIGDAVITTNTQGEIVLMSKVAEKLTGWSQKEAMGQSLQKVFNIIDEGNKKSCKNPASQVLESYEVIQDSNEKILISREGKKSFIEEIAAPIFNEKNEILGVVLVFRDVTEKKKYNEELLKSKQLESVGVLAGGLAHDFNNLLTTILGNVELAGMSINPKEEAYSMLEQALKASQSAKGLTQQLLTFAKRG